jgi:hypothetical protein
MPIAKTVPVTRRALITLLALVGSLLWVSQSPAGAAEQSVFAYGDAAYLGSTGNVLLNEPVVGMAARPSGDGYWLAGRDGRVSPFGSAGALGSLTSAPPSPVVGIAATPTGAGYWLATAAGGVYAFGDAPFYGSLGNVRLSKPIVGIAASPTGTGYWMVASDGGIFTFGTARYMGSTGAMKLNQPIAGMAVTKSGRGYWLVARDGGIFTFGDARFMGSTGAIKLARPIVGMAATPSGRGYWLVAGDGGMFTFGDAPYRGSLGGGGLTEPAVGLVSTPTGQGYWLVTTGHLSWSKTANPAQVVVQAGTYRVSAYGPVTPGTYRALYATSRCHWERRSALSGSEGSVLASNTSPFREVVTIKPGDALFSTSGCAPFINEAYPTTASPTSSFGDGSWIVNADVAAGRWTAPGGPSCLWERVSDFSGDPSALKATDSGTDNPIVDIQPGDAGFISYGCGTWTRR